MIERPCIRCQNPVPLEDGHLSYCSNCGAPQIFLSDDLQAEIAQQTEEYNQRSTPSTAVEGAAEGVAVGEAALPRGQAARQAWPLAVQYALFAAGVTLALGFATVLLPPVGIFLVLWTIAAPILTVGFYNARNPGATPPTSSFAARLGLLTGLLVVLACLAAYTINLMMARYVLHNAAQLDSQLAAAFEQQRSHLLQQMGASVQPTLDLFATPEFRVGLMLFGIAMFSGMYLFLSTVAAGLAGAVLQRRRSI